MCAAWGQILPFAFRSPSLPRLGRLLRNGYSGAIYYVNLGGDRRESILADPQRRSRVAIPRNQRHRAVTLSQSFAYRAPQEQTMPHAYAEGTMTITAIARESGLSVSRVSRMIARAESANQRSDSAH